MALGGIAFYLAAVKQFNFVAKHATSAVMTKDCTKALSMPLKQWHTKKPELFLKNVYKQAELDSYSCIGCISIFQCKEKFNK